MLGRQRPRKLSTSSFQGFECLFKGSECPFKGFEQTFRAYERRSRATLETSFPVFGQEGRSSGNLPAKQCLGVLAGRNEAEKRQLTAILFG